MAVASPELPAPPASPPLQAQLRDAMDQPGTTTSSVLGTHLDSAARSSSPLLPVSQSYDAAASTSSCPAEEGQPPPGTQSSACEPASPTHHAPTPAPEPAAPPPPASHNGKSPPRTSGPAQAPECDATAAVAPSAATSARPLSLLAATSRASAPLSRVGALLLGAKRIERSGPALPEPAGQQEGAQGGAPAALSVAAAASSSPHAASSTQSSPHKAAEAAEVASPPRTASPAALQPVQAAAQRVRPSSAAATPLSAGLGQRAERLRLVEPA